MPEINELGVFVVVQEY